jgi:hypothetical protein
VTVLLVSLFNFTPTGKCKVKKKLLQLMESAGETLRDSPDDLGRKIDQNESNQLGLLYRHEATGMSVAPRRQKLMHELRVVCASKRLSRVAEHNFKTSLGAFAKLRKATINIVMPI